MDETRVEGLLHVFRNVLRSHGGQEFNSATRKSLSLQFLSIWIRFRTQGPETVGPGKRENAGKMRKTNVGPVVEDYGVESHGM